MGGLDQADGRFERAYSGVKRAYSGVLAVVREMHREDVTFMAASIAYHAFVSMLPILLLLSLVVSTFGSERFVTTVMELTRSVLPQAGRRIVTDALRNATGGVGLSVVGVGVLLWGTSKIFRAMDAAFAEIYDTERTLSVLGQLRDALVVFLTLAVVAIGAVVLGSVVRTPSSVPFAEVLDTLIAVVGLAVAFFPMYYVFPDVDVSVRGALPGVLVAAVGWMSLKWLFHLYVALSNKPDVFGLVGTLLLLVTWLYVGSLALLAGASVNATLAGHDGDRTAKQRSKRQFGRQITNVDSLEGELDRLLIRAKDADLSAEEIRQVLRRKADSVEDSEAGDSAVGDSAVGDSGARDEATTEASDAKRD